MKPHEETWYVARDSHAPQNGKPPYWIEEEDGAVIADPHVPGSTLEEVEARCKLIAAAPEMARLLLSLQRVELADIGQPFGLVWCAVCQSQDNPHAPDCPLVKALRLAGCIP